MRHHQGKHIVGYATIRVNGRKPEQFIQLLIDLQIPVWNINIITVTTYEATIYLHHVNKAKELAATYDYVIECKGSDGIFVKLQKLFARKEWIIAGVLSVAFLFLLANTAWKIEIKGVPPYLENAIEDKLEQAGLYEGAWTSNLTPLEIIQEQLLYELPELLYVGIQQNGTSYYVDAIEKKIEKPAEESSGNELIANKSGIIQKVFIKSGVALVERNEMVKKGDILVTSEVESLEEEENEDKTSKKIPVQGKVYANTWYNIEVSAALEKSLASLTGESATHYQIQFGKLPVPVWGWNEQLYENQITEYQTEQIRLWKWTLPITIIQKDLYEYKAKTTTLSRDQITEKTIKHIKENVKRKYGQDAEVLKYYVLHETVDNGKVKMNLYVSLLENIAKSN